MRTKPSTLLVGATILGLIVAASVLASVIGTALWALKIALILYVAIGILNWFRVHDLLGIKLGLWETAVSLGCIVFVPYGWVIALLILAGARVIGRNPSHSIA